MSKVKCIEKPGTGFLRREVTAGKEYEVIREDSNDYYLTDDNNEQWFYNKRFFTVPIPAPAAKEGFQSQEEVDEARGKQQRELAQYPKKEVIRLSPDSDTTLWDVLLGFRDGKYYLNDCISWIDRKVKLKGEKRLIDYIYEFAWHYGRLYHIGDADKIKQAIKEKFQLPEEFLIPAPAKEQDGEMLEAAKEYAESYRLVSNGFGFYKMIVQSFTAGASYQASHSNMGQEAVELEIASTNYAEWLELEGYRIKGMDDATRRNVYQKYLSQSKNTGGK